ncbi:IS5/IS1182 family transposase [Leptospira santarosai]|nr:IS5/IS1182 family transposase [Leptospira santarosai]MDI7227726.1 IS5/IS1182 family transposase [Leptospira santarosai]
MKEKLPGLFDLIFHFEELPKDGDPLVLLNDVIPWEEFRPLLKNIRKTNDVGRGRPAYDEIVMLKVLVLQALNNVSDDRMEFLLKDRLSFMRFLGMKNERSVFPDAKTIWLFKEKLREAELMPKIFYWFNKYLKKKNLVDKICFKGYRNKPLKEKYKKLNTKIARIRGRIEHVFGDMKSFSDKMIRTIGMERAKFQIGFINLVFNFRRFAFYQS